MREIFEALGVQVLWSGVNILGWQCLGVRTMDGELASVVRLEADLWEVLVHDRDYPEPVRLWTGELIAWAEAI